MCGIGSISLLKTAAPGLNLELGADAMMKSLRSRGSHATGLLSVSPTGRIGVEKAAVNADEFAIDRLDMPRNTRACIIHTRFATQGDKGWMKNNHPVNAGNAYVAHNGVVADEWLERKQGEPEVDSYALAFLANQNSLRLEGESTLGHAERLIAALMEVEGSKCVQVAFKGQPMIVMAKMNGNPLFVAETKEGVWLSASTSDAIHRAVDAMKLSFFDITQKVVEKQHGKDVEVEKPFISLYEAADGMLWVWEAGTVTRGFVEAPKEPKHKRPVKPVSTTPPWSQGSYHGNYQSLSDDANEMLRFSINTPVTMENPNHHMFGRKGVVTKKNERTIEVTFEELVTKTETSETTRPKFTGTFSPSQLQYWTAYSWRKEQDEKSAAKRDEAKSDPPTIGETTSSTGASSSAPRSDLGVVTVADEKPRRKSKSERRKERAQSAQQREDERATRRELIQAAIDMHWIDPSSTASEYRSDVAHVLEGDRPCEFCTVWSHDTELKTIEDLEVCGTCFSIISANPDVVGVVEFSETRDEVRSRA